MISTLRFEKVKSVNYLGSRDPILNINLNVKVIARIVIMSCITRETMCYCLGLSRFDLESNNKKSKFLFRLIEPDQNFVMDRSGPN